MFNILYIPFSPIEETNLVELALAWDNQKDERLLIVRYHEGEVELPENEDFQIYILAHGICDLDYIKENKLYNHVCSLTTEVNNTILSMEEVAKRFQEDFLYYKVQIKTIKLYLCNLTDTDKEIAIKFQGALLESLQDKEIHHYEGTLFGPENDKHKYSRNKNGIFLRSSQRRSSLCKSEEQLINSNSINEKVSVIEKMNNRVTIFKTTFDDKSTNQEHRVERLEKNRKEKREAEFNKMRFNGMDWFW